jgi:hypothetical protein
MSIISPGPVGWGRRAKGARAGVLRPRGHSDKTRPSFYPVAMSRDSLVEAYIEALPLTAVAVVSVAGGGCRIERAAQCAPGEIARYFFKPSHVDLVLSAAGLGGDPIDDPPAAVAALIERTAASMGAPFQSAAELQADAEQEVDKIVAKVEAMRQNGALAKVNAQYKAYRQAQIAKAEKATSYGVFFERFVMSIVRDVAMSGRMI